MPPEQVAANLNSTGHEPPSAPSYSLWQLVVYALKLGTAGFGGPVALVGYMYRDLVEARKLISETDYKEGLWQLSRWGCRELSAMTTRSACVLQNGVIHK